MKIIKMVLGEVQTNCYVLYNEESKEGIIIDPSNNPSKIINKLEEEGIKPVVILLTHGHFDHIMAAPKLMEHFGIEVHGYVEEASLVKDPILNAAYLINSKFTMELSQVFHEGDILEFAGFQLKVIHTPGHTKGSVCFHLEDKDVLFSGDTLFYQSVGRTDLPTGDGMMLLRSIEKKLLALADETICYPGHGIVTTIGDERKYNPFIHSDAIWD